MFGRNHILLNYRYGLNGMEKDDDLAGGKKGMSYDCGARLYNPGLGRMLSSDPRENEYPWQSTYAYFSNSPISTLDINGEGGVAVVDEKSKIVTIEANLFFYGKLGLFGSKRAEKYAKQIQEDWNSANGKLFTHN